MRIGLLTVGNPFDDVPYTTQMRILVQQLIEREYEIYYITYDISSDSNTKKATDQGFRLISIDRKINNKLTNVLKLSELNNIIDTHNLSVVITLIDHHLTLLDIHKINCRTIAWYPTHYNPLDDHISSILSMFSDVVCLCPSAVPVIQEAVSTNVVCIPHSVSSYPRPILNKQQLRDKHNIPQDKLVICMVGGNYDMNNRRSYDTSIATFKEYHKNFPNSYLYVQAFTSKQKGWCNDLTNIFRAYKIDPRVYRVNQTLITKEIIYEIYNLSDIFFNGSKSEGFGIPNIEAQLSGLPIVTNKFGAMTDYTFNGIAVPPVQSQFDSVTNGIWSMPDIKKMADALFHVSINIEVYRRKSEDTISTIKKLMNKNTIGEQFNSLITKQNPEFKPTLLCQIVKRLKDNEYITSTYGPGGTESQPKQGSWENIKQYVKSPYVMLLDNHSSINSLFYENLPQTLLISNQVKNPTILIRTKFEDGTIYPSVDSKEEHLNPQKIGFIQTRTVVNDMMKSNSNWNECIQWLELYSTSILTTELVNQTRTGHS